MARIHWSLPLASIFVASVAHADRTETPQQLYKSGDSVSLPTIGATVILPQAPAGWAVSLGMESNSNYDILRRQDPTNPAVQVDFNRPKSPDCASIAKGYDKLIAAGLKLKRYDPTPFAPANFERWGYELAFYQDKSVLKLCTNTPTGPVLAEINFQGALGTLDANWVMPLLDEVGRAVNGSRSADTGGGGGMASSADGQMVTLPLTGLPAMIPPGFKSSIYTSKTDGKQEDLIERVGGAYLSIMVNKKPGSCSLNANSAGAHFAYDPPYLPSGFQSKVVEITTASGTSIAVMCLQKSGYYVLASVGHAGSLSHPDVMVTRTILGPMGAGSSDGGGGGGGSYGSGSPKDFGGSHGSSSDDEKPASRVALELGYAFTSATQGVSFDKSDGVVIGIDSFSRSKEGPIGGAAELVGNIGFGKNGFIPWDARFGIGPALIVNSFVAAPMIGIGADGVGAADDASALHVNSGVYYYYGARMALRFSSSFGIGGYFQLHRRSTDDWNQEQRFGISALIDRYAIGVRATQFRAGGGDLKAGLTNFYFAFMF
ncbi:MAG: hypothetical protein ACXVEE_08745 [Polyangiales bacterium]